MIDEERFISGLRGVSINEIMIPNTDGGPASTMPVVRRESTVPFPMAGIVSLAIGGPVLFALLALIGIMRARRKHRREKTKIKEELEAKFVKPTSLPLHTNPELCLLERSLLPPFMIPNQASASRPNEWLEDESMMDSPPVTKGKARRFSQKGIFPLSGIRDSWPLATSMSNVSLRLLQPSTSMLTLNQIGGGGYVVPPEPKWPRRTYSRKSRTKIVASMDELDQKQFLSGSHDTFQAPYRPRHQRRSASENQLSTILRSTSQRLKSAHRKSLSRTLTSFGRSPDLPPADRPKSSRKLASESKDGLVEPEDTQFSASSIYESYLNRTPSPTREKGTSSGQAPLKPRASGTPSVESIDSLCAGATPDLVIPAALRSPDKKTYMSPQRHSMRISSASGKDLAAMIHEEGQEPALEFVVKKSLDEEVVFTSPHRISLARDPFFSSVKTGKGAMPQNKILGPRPLYIRKTTFGQEATAERPASFVSSSPSPLRNISGNAQSPPRPVSSVRQTSSEPVPNPFNWEPQEARATRTLSKPSRTGSGQKGHKRSQHANISLILRPPNVYSVPEEEECVSPMRFSIPLNPSMRAFDPSKSPSPRPKSGSISNIRLNERPPSITTFNPVLSIPELIEGIRVPANSSPTLGLDDVSQVSSPSLTVSTSCSKRRKSKERFSRANSTGSSTSLNPKMGVSQTHHSVSQFPRPEHKELFSFPPFTLPTTNTEISLASPHQSASVAPLFLNSSPSLPAPPVLTQTSQTPSYLNGPRTEPPKRPSASKLNLHELPPDSKLHQSICLLRRMNSEVSRYSTISTSSNGDEEGRSPPRPSSKLSYDMGIKHRGRKERVSTSSKAYLTMGMGDLVRTPRVGKWQSVRGRVGERQNIKEEEEEEEEEDALEEWERKGLRKKSLENMREARGTISVIKEDQTKKEPAEALKLTFPVLSKEAGKGITNEFSRQIEPPTGELVARTLPSQASPPKTGRWSDATPSPSIRAIRHESQLLEPSPQSSPVWSWRKSGAGKVEGDVAEAFKENLVSASSVKQKYGNWNGNFGRPDSLGLYDSEGFLKSSPGRPEVVDN